MTLKHVQEMAQAGTGMAHMPQIQPPPSMSPSCPSICTTGSINSCCPIPGFFLASQLHLRRPSLDVSDVSNFLLTGSPSGGLRPPSRSIHVREKPPSEACPAQAAAKGAGVVSNVHPPLRQIETRQAYYELGRRAAIHQGELFNVLLTV